VPTHKSSQNLILPPFPTFHQNTNLAALAAHTTPFQKGGTASMIIAENIRSHPIFLINYSFPNLPLCIILSLNPSC
jgi:hypothetical protein